MNSRNRKVAVLVKSLLSISLALTVCLALFVERAWAQTPTPRTIRNRDGTTTTVTPDDSVYRGGSRETTSGKDLKLHREVLKDSAGTEREITDYSYEVDEAGRLTERTEIARSFSADGTPQSRTKKTYDASGNLTETEFDEYELGKEAKRTITDISVRGKTRTKIYRYAYEIDDYDLVSDITRDSTAAPGITPAPPPSAEGGGTDEVMLANDRRYQSYEFYAGFSHNRVDAGDEREGFNGFATSFTRNFHPYAGLKIYYSAHTKLFEENGFDFSSRATIHQGFLGVQFKDTRLGESTVSPFAHLLAGIAHHRFSFDDGVNSFSDSKTGFAAVIGGGLDFRLNDRMDFRVQFDYNPNHIDDQWQDNVRAGFGVVFNFGKRSDDDADDGTDSQGPSVSSVPQVPDAKFCEWNRYNLGRDTHVTQVRSDRPTIVEVRVANLSGGGGFEYHCLATRGTALITYKYTDDNGGNEREGKLRVFCNP